jgi:rhomboid protease GluP
MRAGTSFGKRGGNGGGYRTVSAISAPAGGAVAAAAMSVMPGEMPIIRPSEQTGVFLPWLSLLTLALLSVVFWAELHYPVSPASGFSPSLRTVMALGGVSGEAVLHKGEWWRVFTAPLMHGGLDHIVGNAIALFFAGRFLEKIAGRPWTAAIMVIGALGGVAGSLAMNGPQIVAVGASGAIMAMLAALFVLGFDNQVVEKTWRMQKWTLFLLIPAILPAGAGSHVDVSAHLGGAITGGLLGYFLQVVWDETRERPRFETAAAAIGAIGAGAAALAFVMVAMHFEQSRVQAASVWEPKLMAPQDVPASYDAAEQMSDELVRKFPDDPRAHTFRALHLLKVSDITGAQSEIRLALDEHKQLGEVEPRFTTMLKILLAATQLYQGRLDDAKATAGPYCAAAAEDGELSNILDMLHERGACPR